MWAVISTIAGIFGGGFGVKGLEMIGLFQGRLWDRITKLEQKVEQLEKNLDDKNTAHLSDLEMLRKTQSTVIGLRIEVNDLLELVDPPQPPRYPKPTENL